MRAKRIVLIIATIGVLLDFIVLIGPILTTTAIGHTDGNSIYSTMIEAKSELHKYVGEKTDSTVSKVRTSWNILFVVTIILLVATITTLIRITLPYIICY